MIKWIRWIVFGEPAKSSYACGREYALGELRKHGWEVEARLNAESDGCFNTTHHDREFDRGVRDMIRDFDAQQREIVRNMLR
jgi:Rps23 Pro-64 3,4-dihydroxylase Tpa1-like proline 4-hydroxylase